MVNLWPFDDEKWPPDIWAGGHRPPVAKSQKYPCVFDAMMLTNYCSGLLWSTNLNLDQGENQMKSWKN